MIARRWFWLGCITTLVLAASAPSAVIRLALAHASPGSGERRWMSLEHEVGGVLLDRDGRRDTDILHPTAMRTTGAAALGAHRSARVAGSLAQRDATTDARTLLSLHCLLTV